MCIFTYVDSYIVLLQKKPKRLFGAFSIGPISRPAVGFLRVKLYCFV